MTFLPGIAVVLAAMLSPARIQAKINAIQATLSKRADPPPKYVVYDTDTIIAAYRWQDDDGPNGLVVAYRLAAGGALKRLSTFKYGDSPSALELVDATGDDRPEILVTGTCDSSVAPVEILRWDGKYLSELAETDSTARFADIDGDGIPEILTRTCCITNECGATLGTPNVDRINDDRLDDVPMPDLEDFVDITKSTADAETFEQDVALRNDAPKTCVLHVVNGRLRATSVSIESAGRPIPVEEPVTLESRCVHLRITVTGPKGAKVTILVRAPRT